jgi:LemA protein
MAAATGVAADGVGSAAAGLAALAAAASAAGAAVPSGAEVRPVAGNLCPKCGAAVSPAAKFCNNCGQAIAMSKHSSFGSTLLGLVFLVVVVGLVLGSCGVGGYNKAIRLKENVRSSWAQVDNVLQRRYDLIPNLVETVKGYATHEKELFTQIAESRTKYFQAGTQTEKVEAANGLEHALSRLLMLNEQYPELKAQASFQELQSQLEGSENRIAVERKRYNDAVRELNTYCGGLVSKIYCGWAGVKPAEYFEAPAEAKQVPKVDFSSKPASRPG